MLEEQFSHHTHSSLTFLISHLTLTSNVFPNTVLCVRILFMFLSSFCNQILLYVPLSAIKSNLTLFLHSYPQHKVNKLPNFIFQNTPFLNQIIFVVLPSQQIILFDTNHNTPKGVLPPFRFCTLSSLHKPCANLLS